MPGLLTHGNYEIINVLFLSFCFSFLKNKSKQEQGNVIFYESNWQKITKWVIFKVSEVYEHKYTRTLIEGNWHCFFGGHFENI